MGLTRALCLLSVLLLWAAVGCSEPSFLDADRLPDSKWKRMGLGVAFVPVETRTRAEDAQTVAHMELTGLLFLPGDRGLLAWEKSGRVTHYRSEGDALVLEGELWLERVATNSDCGLISVALDPDWETNQWLYAAHCVSGTFSAVTRYRFDGADHDSVASSGVRVIRFGDSQAKKSWHNVGSIGFFPDPERSMWILVGDKAIRPNGQDTTKNLGGILRIIPSRTEAGGYEPHPDNPFGGPGSDPELQSSPDLYAWGLRSPWRGAIDSRGRIWVGDVGSAHEEINLATAPGQNFGWATVDGPCRSTHEEAGVDCSTLTDPITAWDRGGNHHYRIEDEAATSTARRVAWVGTPYEAHPNDPYEGFLDDVTLIADMCVGFVRAVSVDEAGTLVRDDAAGHLMGLSGSAQAPDGQLYVTAFGGCTSDTYGVGGGIYRVVLEREDRSEPAPPQISEAPLVDEPLGALPLKLSDTGIFADARNTKPIARAIRYEPTLPLWSNGSAKDRWLLLPKGARVDNTDRTHWEFPVGTLFFKTFSYDSPGGSSRIETRIIRRTRAGWDYNVYKWRGGDADLLSLERSLPVLTKDSDGAKLTHEIPSRFDCRSCHESNETVVIGFDELRLNGKGAGKTSQLDELAARGVLAQEPPSDPARIRQGDELTREVLGYLHGNCAHCHNASTRSMSRLDLGYEHALTNLVGVETEGSGQAAGVRVVPGAPEQSVLYQAMSGQSEDPDLQSMPPIGVQRRDKAAIARVHAWIKALAP